MPNNHIYIDHVKDLDDSSYLESKAFTDLVPKVLAAHKDGDCYNDLRKRFPKVQGVWVLYALESLVLAGSLRETTVLPTRFAKVTTERIEPKRTKWVNSLGSLMPTFKSADMGDMVIK